MAIYSKLPLSDSTNGKGILVSASATPGTSLHTSASGSAFDEVWMYAVNTASADATLTVEYGSANTEDNIVLTIPSQGGLVLVIPGLYLENSQNVAAFADSSNSVTIHGYVNRVS